MPTITAEIITAIFSGLIGLLGGISAAYMVIRRAPKEVKILDADAKKTEAEAENIEALVAKTIAESSSMLLSSYERRVGVLNENQTRLECKIEKLQKDLDEACVLIDHLQAELKKKDDLTRKRDERITELESTVEKQGEVLQDKELEITRLNKRIDELQYTVDEYRSGRKKPTGPLTGGTP